MSDEVDEGARKLPAWSIPTGALVLLLAIAGVIIGVMDPSKSAAREACEQVALLRGEGSELDDVRTEHVRADTYRVTATVITPGMPDEGFEGRASRDSGGDYICTMN